MFIAPQASFNRPGNTTQYTANDLVANDVDAADVVPLKFDTSRIANRGKIVAVRLFTDNQVVTVASFNLHIFRTLPVAGAGDNAAYAVASVRDLLATVALDLSSGATASATDKMERVALSVPIVFAGPMEVGAIYGLLQAVGAYTPASAELFEATLEIEG